MVVGCLGDIIFSVSSRKIKTINNAQWSGSARYAQHQRHLKDTLVELTGLDPDGFSFDMYLSTQLNVDVMAELTKIWTYERKGKLLPLAIGDKAYGKYRWVIKNHKVQMQTYDKRGNLQAATVSVTLLEYTQS